MDLGRFSRCVSICASLFALLLLFPIAQGCQDSLSTGAPGASGSVINIEFPQGYTYDRSTGQLYAPSGKYSSALPSYVTGITLTISGEGMETQTYAVDPSTLTVSFSVTPGVRTFTLSVSTSIGLAFGDSVTMDVVSGQAIHLSFSLVINAPPSGVTVTASPSFARPGDVIALSCSANDLDPDDRLTYEWSGAFSGWGQSASFTIPGYGSYTFTCTVRDSRGGSATGSAVATAPAPNSPPVITGFTAAQGGASVVNLTCSAYDPDGDTLTYSYTAPKGDTCNPSTGPTTTCSWRVTGSTYGCTVSDGKNAAVSAKVTI